MAQSAPSRMAPASPERYSCRCTATTPVGRWTGKAGIFILSCVWSQSTPFSISSPFLNPTIPFLPSIRDAHYSFERPPFAPLPWPLGPLSWSTGSFVVWSSFESGAASEPSVLSLSAARDTGSPSRVGFASFPWSFSAATWRSGLWDLCDDDDGMLGDVFGIWCQLRGWFDFQGPKNNTLVQLELYGGFKFCSTTSIHSQ